MSVRYSTPHVHYPQLNSSRVCLQTTFRSSNVIFLFVFECVSVFMNYKVSGVGIVYFVLFSLISFCFRWFRSISFRFYFVSHFIGAPIEGILEILNLTPRCIPMDILAWTDCVRSSAGKISLKDIFPVQICKNIDISLPFTAYIRQNNPNSNLSWPPFYWTLELHHVIKNRDVFWYNLFRSSRCRCQILYYNLKISFTRLEVF
jgi:hypothetical protein